MLRIKIKPKRSPVEYAIMLVCIAGLLISGCTSRFAQVVKKDGTELMYETHRWFTDEQLENVTFVFDKETGNYSIAIKGYNSETSPVVTSILKAVYEAGKTAGGI